MMDRSCPAFTTQHSALVPQHSGSRGLAKRATIAAAAEEFAQEAAQTFGRQFSDELPPLGDADVSGFFGHDQHDRVALGAHADGGPVAAAQLALQRSFLSQ